MDLPSNHFDGWEQSSRDEDFYSIWRPVNDLLEMLDQDVALFLVALVESIEDNSDG